MKAIDLKLGKYYLLDVNVFVEDGIEYNERILARFQGTTLTKVLKTDVGYVFEGKHGEKYVRIKNDVELYVHDPKEDKSNRLTPSEAKDAIFKKIKEHLVWFEEQTGLSLEKVVIEKYYTDASGHSQNWSMDVRIDIE